jgi:hypothetical protein
MLPANPDLWPWLLIFVILAAVLGPVATLRYMARLEREKARRKEREKERRDPES